MTSANSLNRSLLGREREGHINPELPAYFHSPKPAYHYWMLIIIRGLEEISNDISGNPVILNPIIQNLKAFTTHALSFHEKLS